jgi:hypothetical protein
MSTPYALALIFAGLPTDPPGLRPPRFPAAMESVVGDVLKLKIGAASEQTGGSLVGIAAGARGADILFLETCHDLGLDTRMVLPLAPEAFVAASVDGAEGDWSDRFRALWELHGGDEREFLPAGGDGPDLTSWSTRLFGLGKALANERRLLTFWDDVADDGPGCLLAAARKAKATIDAIDAAHLRTAFFGLR